MFYKILTTLYTRDGGLEIEMSFRDGLEKDYITWVMLDGCAGAE